MPAKSQFIVPSQSSKSAFRRANNEITEGLPSGGALVCGEHWQALGYEVSRAYKRRFTRLEVNDKLLFSAPASEPEPRVVGFGFAL